MLTFMAFAAAEQPSLWQELWAYVRDTYLSDNHQYEHLPVGRDGMVNLQTIIIGLFIGVIIAAAIVFYEKKRLGAFVRAVVKQQCLWPDKAKTLAELGFDRNGAVKRSLRSRNHLGRIVRCVERDRYDSEVESARAEHVEKHGSDKDFSMPPYRVDFERDCFYIPDEEHYRAELRYEDKGSGWRAFLLVLIVAVVGVLLLFFLLPEMLKLVDNLIGILSESDRTVR